MMKTNKIDNAFSTTNGIVMFSKKNPECALHTYVDGNNTIISKCITSKEAKLIPSGINMLLYNTSRILLLSSSIILCLHNIDLLHIICALLFNFSINSNLSAYICSMLHFNIKMFHSAEHKVINCYNNSKPLTVANVLNSSRFNINCGSQLIFHKILSRSIAIFILLENGFNFWSICIFIFMFFLLEHILNQIIHIFPLLLLSQILVTKKPSTREVTLAITAMNNYDKMEKKECI